MRISQGAGVHGRLTWIAVAMLAWAGCGGTGGRGAAPASPARRVWRAGRPPWRKSFSRWGAATASSASANSPIGRRNRGQTANRRGAGSQPRTPGGAGAGFDLVAGASGCAGRFRAGAGRRVFGAAAGYAGRSARRHRRVCRGARRGRKAGGSCWPILTWFCCASRRRLGAGVFGAGACARRRPGGAHDGGAGYLFERNRRAGGRRNVFADVHVLWPLDFAGSAHPPAAPRSFWISSPSRTKRGAPRWSPIGSGWDFQRPKSGSWTRIICSSPGPRAAHSAARIAEAIGGLEATD